MYKNYNIPAGSYEAKIEIKKSRFMAHVDFVNSKEDVKSTLFDIKQKYPDARHHCWAYLLGNPKAASSAAANDDGEPGGTAGKPILNVIQHKNVGDIIIVVSRYFGGIKLGAGGLTRAYSAAADAAMSGLALIKHIAKFSINIQCDFSQEQLVRHWAGVHDAAIEKTFYTQCVSITLLIPEQFKNEFSNFCQAQQLFVEDCESL